MKRGFPGNDANQLTNSAQMTLTSTASEAKFITNKGDNFYWCGIQNTTDPQITVDYHMIDVATLSA